MHFVTKATAITNIDSKCHIKKLKSSRTCLIGYSGFISHEWYLLLILSLGADTDTHTHTHTYAYQLPRQKQFQETRRVPGLKMTNQI